MKQKLIGRKFESKSYSDIRNTCDLISLLPLPLVLNLEKYFCFLKIPIIMNIKSKHIFSSINIYIHMYG